MQPDWLLIVFIGSIYGALFHLWQGRSFRDLLKFLIVGVVGFAIGNLIGILLNLDFFTVGRLHPVEGSLFSWATLFIAKWLKV